MSYQLLRKGGILRLADKRAIPQNLDNRDYRDYLEWLAEGNEPEPYVAPPDPPDWRQFLNALRSTTVFTSLRGQARVDITANALATELRTLLGEAALGLVATEAIQALLDQLAPSLLPPQITELSNLIAQFNIPLTIS